jgi:peptide chain release factor 2
MQPLKKQTNELLKHIEAAYKTLSLDAKKLELAALDEQLSDSAIWSDPQHAQQVAKAAGELRNMIEPWVILKTQLEDMLELIELGDESLATEFEGQLKACEKTYQTLRTDLLFNGSFDNHGVILKISSGAGGTDAQDWAEMLERMYLRWCEKHAMNVTLLERSTGDEAGIKSATYSVHGTNAYGKLRSEHGVHRLVRLSPFNSDNLRQTSFAQVEVMPEIDAPDEVVLDEGDLKIDVYRAGGHGGQSVNTTDSAVRVTHLPTGIVVAIQNERSQLQNKETALKLVRSKLAQMLADQHAGALADLRASESAGWGAQIRNYVLHPYTLVKDTRTKYETRDASGVLDGKIDEFIRHFLEAPTEESADN